VPAGSRIVWLLNPRTSFYNAVMQSFPATAAGPIWYTDLPPWDGEKLLGEYRLQW
jgi:hypothetical protein